MITALLIPSLYLIEILHQTTTLILFLLMLSRCILSKFYIKPQQNTRCTRKGLSCILSKFYIKPQQRSLQYYSRCRCILSKFYIKPQLNLKTLIPLTVVSYRNSTSNHNEIGAILTRRMLYLIEILHQTTTAESVKTVCVVLYLIEILHQTTTRPSVAACSLRLYLIEILHQTTTDAVSLPAKSALYLIEILHQTTTSHLLSVWHMGCILSKFYIKPQLVQ